MSVSYVLHGDHTTTGGIVIATLSTMFNDNRRMAVWGDRATCGTCSGSWPIIATADHMMENGRAAALHGDKVSCSCGKNRVIASTNNMQYSHPRGEARAAAASGVVAAAAMASATMVPSSPSRPAAAPANEQNTSTERRCVLRIGVFFDGTNNNAGNTQLFSQCSASSADALGQSELEQQAIIEHCQPYMTKANSSYDNGYTNVWRLYQLYRDSTKEPLGDGERDYFIPLYVDGIGTTIGQPDDLLGLAMGTGETGMEARVKETLLKAIPDAAEKMSRLRPELTIEAIEFDVFGFSRGAAAARHFVHEINRKQTSPLFQPLQRSGARLIADFNPTSDLRVGFVGIFDTVVSRGSLADGFNIRGGRNGPLKVALPAGCARKVVHLIARNEHRANFMLTTARPQHQEIALPGVHSDIGGSYHSDHEGPLMLIEPTRSVEPFQERNGELFASPPEHSRAWQEANAKRRMWLDRLGHIDERAVTVDAWTRMEEKTPQPGDARRTRRLMAYATLRLERTIDWRYQLIPLRVMHKLAKEAGVQWRQSPDDVPAMALPTELQPIADKLLAQQPLSPDEEALLARKYLHQSAHWNMTGYQQGTGMKLLYVNRPELRDIRQVLPNEDH